MLALLEIITPVFLVIGFGYLCVARGWFNDDGVDAVMKYAQNFAIPCLLFQAVSQIDLKATVSVSLLATYYLPALTCFALGALVSRHVFKRPGPDCVAIGFACLFANSVLLGLPVTERAFGSEALAANYAIIAVHAPISYLIGITVMEVVLASGKSPPMIAKQVARATLRNALVIGLLLGFAVNIFNVPLPGVLTDGVDLMARSGLPAALFGLGGVLVRYRPKGDLRVIAFICLVTLLVRPAMVDGLAFAELTTGEIQSAVLTAAMPPGINAYIFANMYGVAKRVSASAVLISTALAVLTLTGWLAYLGA